MSYKRRKIIRIAIAILTALTLFTSSTAFAIGGPNGTAADNSVSDSSGSSYISRIFSVPINGLANAILWLSKNVGFYTIEQLVFPDNNSGPKTAYVFTSKEWGNVVIPWYRLAFAIASLGVVYQIVVLWVGYKTIAASINPHKLVDMQNTMWNIILAMLFLSQMPLFAKLIFQANAVLVAVIKNTLMKYGLYKTAITGISSNMIQDTGDPLLNSLIKLGFASLMLMLNFLYMTRKFILGVLVAISPIVAWSMLSSKKIPMMLLLSEIVSNGFMSASHAIVLAFYASMVNYSEDGMFSAWWAKLFALALLIPVSAFLRRLITGWLNLIGVDEEKYAGMAMLGVGSIVTIGTILQESLGKGKHTGYLPRTPQPKDKREGFGEPLNGPPPGFNASALARRPATETEFNSSSRASNVNDVTETGFKKSNNPTIDSMERKEFPVSEPLPVERIGNNSMPDSLSYTVLTPEEKARANIGKMTGLFGTPLPKKHEMPMINDYKNRKTNIRVDDNTFLGPTGSCTESLEKIQNAERYEKAENTKPERQEKWPTLEKVMRAGKVVLPVAARVGGAAAVAGGAALGLAAGTAFSLPTGNTGNIRRFQMAGAETGVKTMYAAGRIAKGAAIKTYNMVQRRNRNLSNLDKPLLK